MVSSLRTVIYCSENSLCLSGLQHDRFTLPIGINDYADERVCLHVRCRRLPDVSSSQKSHRGVQRDDNHYSNCTFALLYRLDRFLGKSVQYLWMVPYLLHALELVLQLFNSCLYALAPVRFAFQEILACN